MVERPGASSQAVLVSLDFGDDNYAETTAELQQLAVSAGLKVAAVLQGRRGRPDPALFAGSGKVEELAGLLTESGTSLVIFNHEMSAAQPRNPEQALPCNGSGRGYLVP